MLARLMPRQHDFFTEFDRLAGAVLRGAERLSALFEDYQGLVGKVESIKQIEHEADGITHHTVELLHTTFITPFDRDDIHRLTSRLDDIIDAIEAVAQALLVFDIKEPTPEARELSKLIVRSAEGVQNAVRAMRDMRKPEQIRNLCVEVKHLEDQGDAVLRAAVGRLFREETRPLEVMKWKEIYETLEAALDRCEDVANVIEGVLLENT